MERDITKQGSDLSKTAVAAPKDSSGTDGSILKKNKNKVVSEYVGKKKGGASAKIIEAIIL